MEHDDMAFDNTQSHPFLPLLLCGFILALTLSGCGGGGGGNMNLVQQPDTDTEDSTGEGTDTEDNTGEDTDTDPNTTDLTNSPGSADAEAIRAAITRGSMTGPPAPMGITITRNHSAPPTIGIRSNVSGDWSDAGPAPVASGTRHYDGYRLTRHAGGGQGDGLGVDRRPAAIRQGF
ncbi:MAG: hypothetical protein OXL95_09035 [Nitrospira sp.]|nr:hypothetical protein [Nitrospira sp.]MDE0486024.1 hypothetical protein [Nitrospira sp.]